MPSKVEISVASAAAVQPMITDSCAPWMQRDSTSRPRLSVPNQCSADGGNSRSAGEISLKPKGAIQGPKMPTTRNSSISDAAGRAERLVAEQPQQEAGGLHRRRRHDGGGAGRDGSHQRYLTFGSSRP